MHLSRIDLNLLVVFDTVYTEGGITAAGRKLNLSQPAVSHALGRLRELFGEPLFERQGRGIAPTPLARSIAGPVREALAAVERTLGEAGRFEPGTSDRSFRLGLREALEPSVLPRLAHAFAAAGPRLSLATARHDRPRLEQDLAAGEFDVALDVLLPIADRVPHERVLVDRLIVVARKGHPALRRATRRDAWDLEAWLALEHLQVSSRRRGPTLEDMALRPLGRTRRVRLRCQSHAAACAIAAVTDLVATIPETYAQHHVAADAHRLLPLPLEGLALETYMYWSENSAADAANRWLRDQVRRALQSPDATRRRAPRARAAAKSRRAGGD
ncbi:MAG TPA: LysR family transcriptional regulator [Steroidobacteraceae bacterium]|nr:LysR family transcriptional regulator [Steroidobacteraceae bacterium]